MWGGVRWVSGLFQRDILFSWMMTRSLHSRLSLIWAGSPAEQRRVGQTQDAQCKQLKTVVLDTSFNFCNQTFSHYVESILLENGANQDIKIFALRFFCFQIHVCAGSFNKPNRIFVTWCNSVCNNLRRNSYILKLYQRTPVEVFLWCAVNKKEQGGSSKKVGQNRRRRVLKPDNQKARGQTEGASSSCSWNLQCDLGNNYRTANRVEPWRVCACLCVALFWQTQHRLRESRSLAKQSNLVPASLWVGINPHLWIKITN